MIQRMMHRSSSFRCTIHVCRCTHGGRIVNARYYIHLLCMSLQSLLRYQLQLIQPCDQCTQCKRLAVLYQQLFSQTSCLYIVSLSGYNSLWQLTGSIAQSTGYLIYSEANFEVFFRPTGATRSTAGGEIWHGGGDEICRICTLFQDALAVKVPLDLLKWLLGYGGFNLTGSGYPQIFSAPQRRNYASDP